MAAVQWLNDNSGAVQAIATFVLVIVTSLYVVFTKWMATAARRQAQAAAQQAKLTSDAQRELVTRQAILSARNELMQKLNDSIWSLHVVNTELVTLSKKLSVGETELSFSVLEDGFASLVDVLTEHMSRLDFLYLLGYEGPFPYTSRFTVATTAMSASLSNDFQRACTMVCSAAEGDSRSRAETPAKLDRASQRALAAIGRLSELRSAVSISGWSRACGARPLDWSGLPDGCRLLREVSGEWQWVIDESSKEPLVDLLLR